MRTVSCQKPIFMNNKVLCQKLYSGKQFLATNLAVNTYNTVLMAQPVFMNNRFPCYDPGLYEQ